MPLRKDPAGDSIVEPEAPPPATVTPEPEAAAAPPPEPEPAPAPEPKPQPKQRAAAKPADSPKDKQYVTKTGYLRDPTTGITYITGNPRPGTDSGWLRCQIAAGVIVEYKQGEMGG